MGGRVAEALAQWAGGRPFCFFSRAGRVGVEILSSKTGWAWAGARTRPALSEVLGVNGPTQLRSTAQSPVLTAWIAPLDETKVHDSGADGHCVLHMHPGKSLDACILLLHCVYGAQGGVHGPTQLRSTAQSPVLTAWITPPEETKVYDSGADGHCVLHMHHGKSLDACLLLLHCVYGAQGGVNGPTQLRSTT